jgi:RNA polymerase sigma-70 factor, ECF subfamily
MTRPDHQGTDALRLHLTVLRCQAGDEAAFARLHAEFGPRVLGYLRRLVGDEADDVQQEVWATVFRRIADLANPGAFRTWLFRMTRYRAIDHLRRRRREQELFVDDETPEDVPQPDDSGEPLALATVEEWLNQLPTPQREVLTLRYQDDLSYAEIALIVGCSVGTVRSRLFYARQKLEQLRDASDE